jgi:hypothetical protein
VMDGNNDNDNNTCDAQQHKHWRTETGSSESSGSRNEGQRLGARGSLTSKVQGHESELLNECRGACSRGGTVGRCLAGRVKVPTPLTSPFPRYAGFFKKMPSTGWCID